VTEQPDTHAEPPGVVPAVNVRVSTFASSIAPAGAPGKASAIGSSFTSTSRIATISTSPTLIDSCSTRRTYHRVPSERSGVEGGASWRNDDGHAPCYCTRDRAVRARDADDGVHQGRPEHGAERRQHRERDDGLRGQPRSPGAHGARPPTICSARSRRAPARCPPGCSSRSPPTWTTRSRGRRTRSTMFDRCVQVRGPPRPERPSRSSGSATRSRSTARSTSRGL
jgi:hypothetical protein